MKICLVNSLYHPDSRGGVETAVKTIVDEFSIKHSVFVIASGIKHKETIEEQIDKIKIYRIGYEKYFPFQNIELQNFFIKLLWRINQLKNKYSSTFIYQILLKEKPDLILSHNTLGLGYNTIKTINKFCTTHKSKHISTIHDVQLIYPSGILTEKNKKRKTILKIYSFFTRNIYKSCHYIISPSQALLKLYFQYGFFLNSDTKVIPNPIKLELAEKSEKKDNEKLNIIYMGQLEDHKGIFDIIKAIKLLPSDKFYLTIAGRGNLEEKIKQSIYIVNNINFVGQYNKNSGKELLSQNDLVVIPSKCFENSPMVIYEAFEMGVPVLASRIGGIPELVEEDKTGWLFKSGDIENLKQKLLAIYEKKEAIGQMSNNCIEKVKEFDIKNYIKQILEF